MSSSSRKWFWIGLVVAAAAAVGGWAFYRDSRKVEYTTVKVQSAVADAKTKLANRLGLFNQGILSKDDRDTAQAVYDQAVAGLDAANAQVTEADANVASAEEQREVLKSQLTSAQAQVRQQT